MKLSFGGGKEYDSTLAELKKMAEQAHAIRGRFESAWFLNLAFYLGDQWVFWNNGRLDRPRVPKHRLLITDNRIMPAIISRVAKKTKQRPVWTVTPNSPDDTDVDAAQLGEMIVEERWKALHMQRKLFDVLLWADICGSGFWKCYWDKTKGQKAEFIVNGDGSPLLDQNGRPIRANSIPPEVQAMAQGGEMPTKAIAQGDVCIEVRSPFMILPDPLAASFDECEWIIEEVVQSPQYVNEHYGVELEGDTEATPGPADARYFPSSQMGGSSSYKGVKVYEFWAKPGSKYPNGKRCVWAKEQLLMEEDNPYGELPYVMFTGIQVPGRLWPTSMAEQLRGPQVELNKVKSQIAENGQRIGNPSILKDRLANVEYSGVPGEEVLYDSTTPNSVPQFLQPPEMPVYVREQVERIQESLREISGQHEVSSSQVPAGVTAASAINLLLEQDDTRLGPAIIDMENQLSRAGQMILKQVAMYYTEERIIRLAGDDSDFDFIGFKGEMLRGNTDVEVQAGSTFPVSKAAKQAALRDTLTIFIQNGIPLDPRSMRKIVRDMEVGGLEAFFADVTNDLRQVKRENRLMYRGQPVPINGYDNDDFHIAEHEDEMKSARYFRLRQQDPAAAQLFEQHVALHLNRRASTYEAQQQSAMAGMQAQQDMQQQGEMERLQMQQHFDQMNADRDAQLKVRQMDMQQQERNRNPNKQGRS